VTGEEKDKGCGLSMHNKCVCIHNCIYKCICLYICMFIRILESTIREVTGVDKDEVCRRIVNLCVWIYLCTHMCMPPKNSEIALWLATKR